MVASDDFVAVAALGAVRIVVARLAVDALAVGNVRLAGQRLGACQAPGGGVPLL